MFSFKNQEAVDRQIKIKQKENQLEQMQEENIRLRKIEANFENIQVRFKRFNKNILISYVLQ